MHSAHMANTLQAQKNNVNGLSQPNTVGIPNTYHIHNLVETPIIRDVWEDNFEEEFSYIMQIIEKCKVIAMDTEFPGIFYKLTEADLHSMSSHHEIEYRTIKLNVDQLKVIQVGLSFADENGYLPHGVTTWQFNFKFDVKTDDYSPEAIELLSNSGIKFDKHATRGINPQIFAEYLISSGLVLNDEVKWITFHGGFDFAYLLKMLDGQNLPDDDESFYSTMEAYFPSFFDIKCMVRDIDSLKSGGLNKLAADLSVKRIGPQHQAGSDSLLTLSTYFKLKDTYLKGVPEKKHANILHGIGAIGDAGPNDYVWQNYIASDYSYPMMNTYGMNNMQMMGGNYYSQTDTMYSNMMNGNYNMQFPVVYNNFGPNSYVEPNPKSKKYDSSIRKLKNPV